MLKTVKHRMSMPELLAAKESDLLAAGRSATYLANVYLEKARELGTERLSLLERVAVLEYELGKAEGERLAKSAPTPPTPPRVTAAPRVEPPPTTPPPPTRHRNPNDLRQEQADRETLAKYRSMPPGPERSEFYQKHRDSIFRGGSL